MVQPQDVTNPLSPILEQFRLNVESLETTLRFLNYSRSQYANLKTHLESFHNMHLSDAINREVNGLSTSVLISESGERDSSIRKHYLRQVSNVESEIERLDGEIDSIIKEVKEKEASGQRLKDLVQNLEKLDSLETSETVNEDGLPFMEIREELDDDDKVSRATVVPQRRSEPKIEEVVDEESERLDEKDEHPLYREEPSSEYRSDVEDTHVASENVEEQYFYSQPVPTEELLELELIADELNDESDYSQTDDSEDETFYSMIPGNDKANDLLTRQIQSLRAGTFSSGTSESVMNDICEHDETVSEEKPSTEVIPDEPTEVLPETIPRETTQKKSNLKSKSSQSKKSVSFAESLQIKVVDNVSDDLKRIVHEPAARVSRFKQNRLNSGGNFPVSKADSTSDVVGDVVERRGVDVFEKDDAPTDDVDLNSMAKAYINGDYDDDINSPGEVVEKLSDFERINRILKERGQELEEVEEEQDEEDESDSGPIVEHEIVEKEVSVDNNEIDSDMLRQEVASDYYRLRTKMMHQYGGGFKETEREKERIPVDKDGNERKMSRFMAAKRRGVGGWNA